MQQSCLLIVIVLRRAKNSMGKLQHLPSSTQCTQANRHPLKEWEFEPIQIKQQFPIQLSCKYECLLSQNVNSKLHMCFFVKLSPLGLNCSLLLTCFSSPCLPFLQSVCFNSSLLNLHDNNLITSCFDYFMPVGYPHTTFLCVDAYTQNEKDVFLMRVL